MNQKDLKRIAVIADELEKAGAAFEHLCSELTDMHGDEQEKFDNLTDGLKAAESGQRIEAAASALESAAEKAQSAFDALDEAVGELRGIE